MWVVGHLHLGNEIVFFMNGTFYPQCNNSFANYSWNRYHHCEKNVLERHTDRSRHQRQSFSRSGRTRLSYNTVGWQRAKTTKHKILFSASNFAHCFHVLTIYRACSICMNPGAGPECKNLLYLPSTSYGYSLSPVVVKSCRFRGLRASYAAYTYQHLKRRRP